MASSDRFVRQADLVPQDKLQDLKVTVIGVGAVGRQVALQLAQIGVRELCLIDHDTVDLTNITTQGYKAADIGKKKVVALRKDIEAIDATVKVETWAEMYRPSHEIGKVWFCGVDKIDTRASIWQQFPKEDGYFWADSRMLGEVVRVLTACNDVGRKHYQTTLFAPEEAEAGRCTARSTTYTANVAAGLLISAFARWLRGVIPSPDMMFSLFAEELTHMMEEKAA